MKFGHGFGGVAANKMERKPPGRSRKFFFGMAKLACHPNLRLNPRGWLTSYFSVKPQAILTSLLPNLAIVILMITNSFSVGAESEPESAVSSLRYSAREGAVIGHNLPDFNNRPLYLGNTNVFVLTGDRPFVRFCHGFRHYGSLMIGVRRGEVAIWLQNANEVESVFRAGSMQWKISDSRIPGLSFVWEVVPVKSGIGFASRIRAGGALPGDELIWAYGGASARLKYNLNWSLDTLTNAHVRRESFRPDSCKDNQFSLVSNGFTLTATDENAPEISLRASAGAEPVLRDASTWESPATLLASQSGGLPVGVGVVDLSKTREFFLSVKVAGEPWQAETEISLRTPAEEFAAGEERIRELASRIEINTPDPFINAAAGAVAHALDGVWYPPSFVHGAMLWNARYPGWRTTYGATVGGWHDRVLEQARYHLSSIVKESSNTSFELDPEKFLTKAALDSRYYGKGRITRDQSFYNMQTQLFAQLIHAWRWTGDPELEEILRPALELHLEWMQECFDPDLDGTYESYINTWPTDSIWFSGGGTPDETSYAYKSHEAARDLARRAGDNEAVERHEAALARIRDGFFKQLWSAERGHPGLVREQAGHRRLKLDPWLYGIFLPVESGMLNDEQKLTALRYSEWALQNDPAPAGGRRVWTSNFVPGIWSVRELWPGDNYHLALAYFQAGLPEDGWDVLRGTFVTGAFNQPGPGNLGSPQGGTDFGDCINPFARTLVEGLFGFQPDYPNDIVRIAPGFPPDWDHASIRTPDFSLFYERKETTTSFDLSLTRPAPVALRLPVSTTGIRSVKLDGRPLKYALEPGFGVSLLEANLPSAEKFEIVIETADHVPAAAPVSLDLTAGKQAEIAVPGLKITGFSDPQGILDGAKISDGILTGKVIPRNEHATLLAKVEVGSTPQWRVFEVRISDPEAQAARDAETVATPPADARWQEINLTGQFNADIRQVYQQDYLSPRPATISVRIGTDGYSPWTFPHWQSGAPEIKLDAVSTLLDPQKPDLLLTPQGVPFLWPGMEKNIAFTSLWDNFPESVTIPVGRQAEVAYFLVAGSTNVMQNRIANAVIRLNYADGSEDKIELVPPFNFWNLSPIRHRSGAPGQNLRPDYTDPIDAFAVPQPWPERVQLGENCRAILLNRRLRPGVALESVTLETLSPEVVIGLMGITLLNPVQY